MSNVERENSERVERVDDSEMDDSGTVTEPGTPPLPEGAEFEELKRAPKRGRQEDAGEEQDVDDIGLAEVGPDSEGKFRIQCKAFFLTYSQVGETKEFDVCSAIIERYHSKGIKCLECATESHRDTGKHFHIFLLLDKRLDSRDPKCFDVCGFHPNIKKVTKKIGSLNKIYHYLCKEGNIPKSFAQEFDFFPSSERFIAKKADFLAWLDYKKERKKPEPVFPRIGPHRISIHAPVDSNRKRHYWIYGPFGCGKTTWFEREFGASRYFKVNCLGRYPFDGYEGQTVILYDDGFPGKFHLTTLCNPRQQRQHVPGDTRYCERYLAPSQPLLLIVLMNASIDDSVLEEDRGAYTTRFNEIFCENSLAFAL